jgi:hypothetical protein
MKVSFYKDSKGQLHETHAAYSAAEAAIKTEATLTGVDLLLVGFEFDDRDNQVLHAADVKKFIAANAEVLREVLNDAVVVKRGRKPKVKAEEVAQAQA